MYPYPTLVPVSELTQPQQEVVFHLSGVPNLKLFRHDASSRQLYYVLTHMPQHTPKLKHLLVRTSSDWDLRIPESITIFREAATLELIFTCHRRFDILKIIPSLPELILKTCCSEDIERGTVEHDEYAHKHLKEVELKDLLHHKQV